MTDAMISAACYHELFKKLGFPQCSVELRGHEVVIRLARGGVEKDYPVAEWEGTETAFFAELLELSLRWDVTKEPWLTAWLESEARVGAFAVVMTLVDMGFPMSGQEMSGV